MTLVKSQLFELEFSHEVSCLDKNWAGKVWVEADSYKTALSIAESMLKLNGEEIVKLTRITGPKYIFVRRQ